MNQLFGRYPLEVKLTFTHNDGLFRKLVAEVARFGI